MGVAALFGRSKPRSEAVPPARFELVTRDDCHLCHEMEALLRRVLPRHGLELELVDVDADPALVERFGDTVPVLLRDGKPVAKVRLTERQLVRIVQRRSE